MEVVIVFGGRQCQSRTMNFTLVPAAMVMLLLSGHVFVDADNRSEPEIEAASYATRDGEAEALAALSAGKPPRLFTHVWNGRAPGFRTPGLRLCSPDQAVTLEERSLFLPLPEADWSEPSPLPLQYDAAVRFARAYNLTMYARRKAQIVRVCPRVDLDR